GQPDQADDRADMLKGETIGGADSRRHGNLGHAALQGKEMAPASGAARSRCHQNSSNGRRSSNTGAWGAVASRHRPVTQPSPARASGDGATFLIGPVTIAQRRRGTKAATLTAATASSPAPSIRRA